MGRQKTGLIDFKLQMGVAIELLALYEYWLSCYEYDDELDLLLLAHMQDMYKRIATLVDKMERSATLMMSKSEAVAFVLLWNKTDISAMPLADVLVRDMIMKIDKRVKELKLVQQN